ncbi:S1C family serine protease [Natribacillus halophilus]|uniref:Trypsin-like peptidase domain-containing protein n=1 Tax=Natribacillus halophilus TaxID=549003 RepID=A0A1G8J6Z9_9BACI|nr:serine protease [Natribacillus halophilus]SDI27039.1 Trypsin-like peptidase domain-containing protein [Natribacillus halophilus]
MDRDNHRDNDRHDEDEFLWEEEEGEDSEDDDIPPEEPPLEAFLREEVDDEITMKKKRGKKRWMKLGIIFASFLLIFQGVSTLVQFIQPDVVDFLTTSYELSQDEDVAEWRESVVTLQVEQPGASARGTGFFIDDDGLIATNRHVVEDAFQIGVSLHDGSAYEASIVSQSEDVDLALIEIEEDIAVDPLQLQPEGAETEEGTNITIIGNPLNFTGIANEGEILDTGNPTTISAPTYRGNSGSPAINDDGEVVGVIYATRQPPPGQGGRVGLMVPTDEVWQLQRSDF